MNDDRADWREAWALFPGDVAYVYVWHGALHATTVAEIGQYLSEGWGRPSRGAAHVHMQASIASRSGRGGLRPRLKGCDISRQSA